MDKKKTTLKELEKRVENLEKSNLKIIKVVFKHQDEAHKAIAFCEALAKETGCLVVPILDNVLDIEAVTENVSVESKEYKEK